MSDKKTNKEAQTQKRVKVLVDNLAGKYLLPWNKGQVISIEAKQAEELIQAKDAEEVK